ncbi:MAG: hypothetical protein KatS3mg087_2111 [Patescibacteria group bacterium]|nr:MAG: hypothetical protein KatS3mg087_2111 [Patescibacteria group bacterium]
MNKTLLKTSIFIIGILLVTIALWVSGKDYKISDILPTASIAASPIISSGTSSTSWVSKAIAVEELVLEADIIVRARVIEPPTTRVVQYELPVWDEQGNIVGTATSQILFSDTVFEVLEIYLGQPSHKITVMQTGGFDPSISRGVEEIADDPLYKLGEEYILFLVDISGDHVHAPDRELYRIVNPFGRYRVIHEKVISYGQSETIALPTNITDLEFQIEQSVQERNK